MRISDTVKSNAIAIIGMCKNAGKTTVLDALISAADSACLGLTSIGRDGETVDVATVTPKPDIYVHEGTVFATASELLRYCDTTLCILDTCGIYTPLGEVILALAMSDGNIQIAGPSTVEGLVKVHEMMKRAGAERCIFDGAISRKSLAVPSLCKESVLCSGASYSPSMTVTIEDTAFFARLFTLDTVGEIPFSDDKFILEYSDEKIALDSPTAVKDFIRLNKKINCVYIRGAVTDAVLSIFTEAGVRSAQIIAEDPSRFIISKKTLEKCDMRDLKLGVTRRTELCAVAVNPFSAYGAAYDAHAFYDGMSRALEPMRIHVFDVKQEK